MAVVAAVILVASLLPASGSGGSLPVSDKLVHGVGYAVLAALVVWAGRPVGRRSLALVVVAVAGFGGLVELLQWPLATRQASVLDAVANLVGAVVGTIVASLRVGGGEGSGELTNEK